MPDPGWEHGRTPRDRLRTILLVAAGVVAMALGARSLGPGGDGPTTGALEVASPEPAPPERADPRPSARLRPGAPVEAIGEWRDGRAPPLPAREGATTVWTGSEVLVFGGEIGAADGLARELRVDGAAYDPAADRWRVLPPAPLEPRRDAAIAWTGAELVVWGGAGRVGLLADGAAYDPAGDAWRALPAAPLSPRSAAHALWTGRELLVLGGTDLTAGLADGAAYDPVAGTWRPVMPAPHRLGGPGRPRAVSAWAGTVAVLQLPPGDGDAQLQAYDPVADAWAGLPALGGDGVATAITADGDDLVAVVVDAGRWARPRVDRLHRGASWWVRDGNGPRLFDVGTTTAFDAAQGRLWVASPPPTTMTVAFDTATGIWYRLPPRPAAGSGLAVVPAGEHLVVLGLGAPGGATVQRWRAEPPLESQQAAFASAGTG